MPQPFVENLFQSTGRRSLIGGLVACIVMVIAGAVRVACAHNELWFDEIMSIQLANQVSGWWGILSEFRYDNNHYLNSFWLYALGINQHPFWFRAPSIVAGLLVVPVAYWTVKPYGRTAQVVAAILFAFSYAHVHYSTEARGYALQVLFVVAAFGFMDRYHRAGNWKSATGFGVCASMALLSHLLTTNFLLACGFWTVSFHSMSPLARKEQFKRIAVILWLPFLTGVLLYAINVQFLKFGGGPRFNTVWVTTSAWSLVAGLAKPGRLRAAVGVSVIIALAASLYVHMQREEKQFQINLASGIQHGGSQTWKFFLILLFLLPLTRLAVPSSLLFTRYFLLQITFAFLLLAILASYLATSTVGRRLVWSMLIMFAVVNLFESSRLVTTGRGSYRLALNAMQQASDDQDYSIAFSNRILNEPLIHYFDRIGVPSQASVEVIEPEQLPDWFVLHETMDCVAEDLPPPADLFVGGQAYELKFVSRASYLSGFKWSCYQRSKESVMTLQ